MSNIFTGKIKYLYIFLIFSIFVGIFVRFYGIEQSWLERDEPLYMVGEIKLNKDGNPYDPRLYHYQHPPVAQWFIGFPTRFIEADYSSVIKIPPQMYVFSYMVPLKEVYVPMRMVSAIFGVLAILLIFLIGKNLFNIKAGIWAALLASLSFDLIFYSRWVLSESVFVCLALFTIYFYIKYLQAKNENLKIIFISLTIIFFILALGTRLYTPLFLIPILVISQFMIKKGKKNLKENIAFLILIIIGVYMLFEIIWSAPAYQASKEFAGVTSAFNILQFSLHWVFISLIFRNSYLFLFSLIILFYGFYIFIKKDTEQKLSFDFEKIKNYLKSSNLSLILIVFIIICVLGFGFTRYHEPRYQVIMFLPFFILCGRQMEKMDKNKIIMIITIALVILNFYMFTQFFPYYGRYQNFSTKLCGDYAVACTISGLYNHIPEIKDVMEFLKNEGNPVIITNEHNLILFYEGKALPITGFFEEKCNKDYIENLVKNAKYIVYYGAYSGKTDIKNDQYYCQFIRELKLDLVKSFGNYSEKDMDPESLKVKIYKIGS